MPVINIITNNATSGVTITSISPTEFGDPIVSSIINGVTFIQEDISKQIGPSLGVFGTSFAYIAKSLEVFVNGVKLSSGFDFEESLDLHGFSFIELGINFQKWINANTCISIKYIVNTN
jgi:hypothetical protein